MICRGLPRITVAFLALVAGLCLPLLGTGCRSAGHGLVVAGSTSVQPVMEKIGAAFQKKHPNLKVTIEGGGSSAGVMAARTGTAQLGMSSRKLKPEETADGVLTAIPIAIDAIAVIVHPTNPVSELTLAQLRGLFAGRLPSWKDVGGPDRQVHLLVREEGSGTRNAFEELAMREGKEELPFDPYALIQDSTGGIREVVKSDPDAIGFISLGAVATGVKVLRIEGERAEAESVRTRRYKLMRPFFLLANGRPEGPAADLLAFAIGSEAAPLLAEEGLVSVGGASHD